MEPLGSDGIVDPLGIVGLGLLRTRGLEEDRAAAEGAGRWAAASTAACPSPVGR